ncbi:MAG: amino acid permease [Gammaproteobacteria bacterium]|nr:amino acid permease [Gammaproteobacteria bacterium]
MHQPKELGFWMCTALVIGNTIGMGIFVLPASLAPYGLNAMLGWCVTVVGMTMLARVFAQLAREFPSADGPYTYIERTTGKLPAYIAVWSYWVSCWITNAALAIGIVGYLTKVVPSLEVIPAAALATVLIWLFVGINLLGVRTGGGVQIVTTALKLLPLFFILGLGAWLLVTEPSAYTQHTPATPITLEGIMAASTIALFAMLGIESAAVPAGRVRDPERNIPRATLYGTLLMAAIYIGVSAMAMLLLQQDRLAQSSAPFADLLDEFVGDGNGRLLSVFVVISGLGALNGWTLLVSELTASLGRHGFLPARACALNSRGAPAAALTMTGVLASAMVLMNYSKSMVDGFTFLTQVVTAANLPLYLLCSIALVVLARRGERNLPASLFVLGLLGTAYVVFAFIGLGSEPFIWSLVLGACGLPLYWLMRRPAIEAPAQ